MPKKSLCWKTLDCKETTCTLFGKKNYKCWLASNTLRNGERGKNFLTKLQKCFNCSIFSNNLTLSSAIESLKLAAVQLNDYIKKNLEYEERLEILNKELSIAFEKALTTNEILHSLIEFLPDATFVIDKDKRVIEWNRAMEELTGVPKSEIIGKSGYLYAKPFYGIERPILIDLLDTPDEEIEKSYINFERRENLVIGEVFIPSLGGRKDVYLWGIASPIYNKKRERIGAIESIRDISEFKRYEKMLIDVNEQLRLWVNELELRTKELSILIETIERLQSCVSIDEAYTVITGAIQRFYPLYSGCLYVLAEEKSLHLIHSWGEPLKSKSVFKPEECQALQNRKIHLLITTEKGKKCAHLDDTFSGGSLCIPLDMHDEIIGLIHLQVENDPSLISLLEMEESKYLLLTTFAKNLSLAINNLKLRERLYYQAIRDPLTGLFNRNYMEETFEREIQRAIRKELNMGVIMFDIDHFKRFNDNFGHLAGDMMLKEIASFVTANVRKEDIVSRYGGEEFLIIMPDASLSVAKERAEFLRRKVKDLKILYQDRLLDPVTLSFGVSSFPLHGKDVEILIKKADEALYRAKGEGRDRVVVAELNNDGGLSDKIR